MSPGAGGDRFASVAVPVPVRRLFTYRVGASLSARVGPGARVRIPFGHRKVVGTVVEWPASEPDPEVEVKPIESVLPAAGRLSRELLELTRFVADYYLCSWGEAIEAALPPYAPALVRKVVRRLPAADTAALSPRAVARRRLLETLPRDGSSVPLAGLGSSERRAVAALERLGWVERLDEPVGPPEAEPSPNAEPATVPFRLTEAQSGVLGELAPVLGRDEFAPFLLHGATGSGKTEVYLRAAREVLDRGGGVLYLVPEIGLTPLLVGKIADRFPGALAVLHSGLSRRERYRAWEQVKNGRRRLVVGTRSAIFAPVRDLGLIVVDEEHDGSYKQEETPRYNARDLAIVRARAERAVALLGSATPSMESFQHTRSGRYRPLRLGGRIAKRPLPSVTIVDMRDEYRAAGEVTHLSERLAKELRGCVERGEQALVLRNRRGWAAAIFCPTCGNRVTCDACSVAMTWHRSVGRLRCHYCGEGRGLPSSCPTCNSEDLRFLGEGTERIEELIGEVVPGATVERMDRDTIRRRGAHEKLLRRFESGEIDVLVGTQMIAKGHDFPRVTLVGVLSADQALGLPDFRASERVFQLLTQVAGRAGRGERPGKVVIQAFDPDHPILQHAAAQDYEAFFAHEIAYRRAMRYPPLAALVQLVVQDREAHRARRWAELIARSLRQTGEGRLLIGGPGPAPIERLKGRYRQQILVRTAGRRRLIGAVERAIAAVEGRVPRRGFQLDVDPYSLL